MSTRDRVTDEQWELIERIVPSPSVRSDGRGRPWKNNREVLKGIIWILRSGARWKDLARDFPSHQTCHRRFQQWVTDGSLRKILEVLARDLEERGEIDLQECFIDGSFSGAKKGGLESLKSKDSSCPNRFYALKTLSTSPVKEYDYVQIATSTSCVHVLVHPDVYCYLCTIRYL